ncbi:hypothetical protein NEFER03_2268 [Nematocida sp. LUAm3]|nr:hypothetical protein NEFER03_2268 [Nematocida sp. LUAm3]KAI5176483.1 hypothetical protein NEFER02_2229 [Nematocida sp. LUAm2]KAI5179445.1 hypothetical protein NEFER01_2257 [Nematocida sp. LUAm1]
MRKIRNAGVLSTTLSISTLLLLFAMAYGTECTGPAQARTQKKNPACSSISKNRSILYSPTEKEKQDSTVMGLKQMIKDQQIAEEDVLYLAMRCNNSRIEFLGKDKRSYFLKGAQDILKMLNSKANSHKAVWMIFSSPLTKHIEDILNKPEMINFFQAVCSGRSIVLGYIGKKQYDKFLEIPHFQLTQYTIRLRKLIALWRFLERYEEVKCNLILYNAVSKSMHPRSLMEYITNIFTNNWFRFNKAFVIKNTSLTSSVAMTKNEKKIIELMGTAARLSYENILEYLERLKNRNSPQSIQSNEDPSMLQDIQSIATQSTLFSLPPIAFIFVDFRCNYESSFPLPIILDIASRQNCGIFAQMVDKNTSSFTIVENYDLGQIEMSFDFWKTFNARGLYFLLDQQYCFFLIRNAHYNTFYSELQKKEEEEKKKKHKKREHKKIKNRQYRKKNTEREEEKEKEKEKQRKIEKKEMSMTEKERATRERNRRKARDLQRKKRKKEAENKRRMIMGREMTESEKKEIEILRFPFIFSTLPKSLSDLLASTSQQNNYTIANTRIKRKYSNIKITDVVYYAKKGIIIMQSVSEIDTPADSQTPPKPVLVDILIFKDDVEEEPSLETERVADITSRYDRDTLAYGYLSHPLLMPLPSEPYSDAIPSFDPGEYSHPISYTQLNSDCNSNCNTYSSSHPDINNYPNHDFCSNTHHNSCPEYDLNSHLESNPNASPHYTPVLESNPDHDSKLPPSLLNDILSLEEDYDHYSTTQETPMHIFLDV